MILVMQIQKGKTSKTKAPVDSSTVSLVFFQIAFLLPKQFDKRLSKHICPGWCIQDCRASGYQSKKKWLMETKALQEWQTIHAKHISYALDEF